MHHLILTLRNREICHTVLLRVRCGFHKSRGLQDWSEGDREETVEVGSSERHQGTAFTITITGGGWEG